MRVLAGKNNSTYGSFHKWGVPTNHPFLDGIFPCKPSIIGRLGQQYWTFVFSARLGTLFVTWSDPSPVSICTVSHAYSIPCSLQVFAFLQCSFHLLGLKCETSGLIWNLTSRKPKKKNTRIHKILGYVIMWYLLILLCSFFCFLAGFILDFLQLQLKWRCHSCVIVFSHIGAAWVTSRQSNSRKCAPPTEF